MSAENTNQPDRNAPSAGAAGAGRSPLRDLLRGIALIFDFDGTLGRRRLSTVQNPTDADALAADWKAVGGDLRRAMGNRPSHPGKVTAGRPVTRPSTEHQP